MIALLTSAWPVILGALMALGGVLFGYVHKQKADVAKANAMASDAEKQNVTDKLNRVQADQAATQAAQKVVDDVSAARVQQEAQTGVMTSDAIDKELQDDFSRP